MALTADFASLFDGKPSQRVIVAKDGSLTLAPPQNVLARTLKRAQNTTLFPFLGLFRERAQAEREKNKKTWEVFASKITAIAAVSHISALLDYRSENPSDPVNIADLENGKQPLTQRDAEFFLRCYEHQQWINEKMQALFTEEVIEATEGFTEATATPRHIQFLSHCRLHCYDDDKIRELSGWISATKSKDPGFWINQYYYKKQAVRPLEEFAEAVMPGKPREKMLQALYQFFIAKERYAKNADISTLLSGMKTEQVHTFLNNLMSHTYTHQMLAFQHTLIASVNKKNADHLKGIVGVLDDILDACATCVDGDKPQQVKNWKTYYSKAEEDEETKKAEYGNYLAFINHNFFADLKKAYKAWTGVDLGEKLSLPKMQLHETTHANSKTHETLAYFNRYYQNALNANQTNGEQCPFIDIPDFSHGKNPENTFQEVIVNNGFTEQFSKDLGRCIHIVNGQLVAGNTSNKLDQIKKLIPQEQWLLVSSIAHQAFIADILKGFLVRSGTVFSSSRKDFENTHVTTPILNTEFRIHSNQESNRTIIEITGTSYLNLIKRDDYGKSIATGNLKLEATISFINGQFNSYKQRDEFTPGSE